MTDTLSAASAALFTRFYAGPVLAGERIPKSGTRAKIDHNRADHDKATNGAIVYTG